MNFNHVNPLTANIEEVKKLAQFAIGMTYERELILENNAHYDVIMPYCSINSEVKHRSSPILYWDLQQKLQEDGYELIFIEQKPEKVNSTFAFNGQKIDVHGKSVAEVIFRLFLFNKVRPYKKNEKIQNHKSILDFSHIDPLTSPIDEVKVFAQYALDLTYEKEIKLRSGLYFNVIVPYCHISSSIKYTSEPIFYWDLNNKLQDFGFYLGSAIQKNGKLNCVFSYQGHIFEVSGENMEEIAYRILLFNRVGRHELTTDVTVAVQVSNDISAA